VKNYHDGGEAILEAFRNLDVDYVISSPGSEWPSFWEAMARQKHAGASGPTYLNCGHETIAVTLAPACCRARWRSAPRARWKRRCW
jgi:acetolactate synthase-1/2/3 large subunit